MAWTVFALLALPFFLGFPGIQREGPDWLFLKKEQLWIPFMFLRRLGCFVVFGFFFFFYLGRPRP